jgi:septum formation protein
LELVRGLELNPITWLKEVDESFPAEISGPEIALHVTRLKAQAYWEDLEENDVLITGDTVVLLGNEVLQKPTSREEAKGMLEALSGKTHTVASGIAVTTKISGIQAKVDTTEVTFHPLEPKLIDHYLDGYQPFDKAGAYGVQDLIGFAGVSEMKGSYFTVMGMPTHLLFQLINNLQP